MKRKYTSLPFTEYPVAEGHYDTTRKPITKVVLHSSASTRQVLINTFAGGTRMVSAHYGIDNDGSILAFLEEYNTAYAVGKYPANQETISIEHIDNGATVKLHTDAQYETSIKLVKDICNFYNLPIDADHIVPHSSITATACPNGLDVERIIRGAQGTAPVENTQDKKDIESMNNLRAYNNVWYESKNIIADYEARVAEIKSLQDETTKLKKQINELESDLSLSADSIESLEMEIDKAEEDHVAEINSIISKYEIDIARLKKKRKTIKVETPLAELYKGKTISARMRAIKEILSA